VPDRLGITAGQPLDIGKNAVTPLGLKTLEGRREDLMIIWRGHIGPYFL
jgi:hypothetical protein